MKEAPPKSVFVSQGHPKGGNCRNRGPAGAATGPAGATRCGRAWWDCVSSRRAGRRHPTCDSERSRARPILTDYPWALAGLAECEGVMRSVMRAVTRPFGSLTFRWSFGLILLAEAVTVCIAWLMLGINTSAWIHEQTARLEQISQQAASSSDWSRLGEILDDKNTSLRTNYRRQLAKLSRPFTDRATSVYVVVTDHGRSYEIYDNDSDPTDVGEAPPWELEAYSKRTTTYTPVPFTDEGGSYLKRAFTPIAHNGGESCRLGRCGNGLCNTSGLPGNHWASVLALDFASCHPGFAHDVIYACI